MGVVLPLRNRLFQRALDEARRDREMSTMVDICPPRLRLVPGEEQDPHVAGDGPRPVRAGGA